MKTKVAFCSICDKKVNARYVKDGIGCGGHISYLFLCFILCCGSLLVFPFAIPFIMLIGSIVWVMMFFYDAGKYRCHICGGDKLLQVAE